MATQENIEVIAVRPPQLVLNNKRVFTAVKGSLVSNAITFPAPSPNNSSVTIICTPPSADIAISRYVLKRAQWTVTVTGTNTSGSPTLLQPGYFGPRSFPITEITNTEQFTINQATVTQAPQNQFWPPSQWYSSCHDITNGPLSSGYSMLDKSQNYADLAGSALNPLLGYAEGNGYEVGRASAPNFQVLTNTATSATLSVVSIEPCFLSPFASGAESYKTPALIGVSNMTYNLVFANNRIMSMIANQGVVGINITSVVATLTNFALEFTYLTPDPSQNIPRSLISSYSEIQQSITNSNQTVAPNAQITISSTNFQLVGIPQRLLIYVGQSTSAIAADTMGLLSDSYFGLATGQNVVQLQWNNNTFLTNYSDDQIYNICVANGLQMSWPQWKFYCGSIIVLEFGTDIGVGDLAPGVMGNFQIQVTVQVVNTNQTLSIVNPQLQIFAIYPGVFSIINGSASTQINVLSPYDAMNAKKIDNINYQAAKNIYGGFFSGFADLLSKGHDFLKNSKAISNISGLIPHPIGQAISGISGALGYGERAPRRRQGGRRAIRGRGLGDENTEHRSLASRTYGAGAHQIEEYDSEDEDEY